MFKIFGVEKGLPVPIGVVLVGLEYQFNEVPVLPAAANVTLPGPHRLPGVVLTILGLFTVTVTTFDVAVLLLHVDKT